MANIALLRCIQKPNFITWDIGDIENFFDDDRKLISAFAEKGHLATHVVWNDPSVNWKEFDIAIIRSTWDYIDHCEAFLDVLQHIENEGCLLYNDYKTVKWNADKNYLLDLMEWQAPVVPTYKATYPDLPALFKVHQWSEAIIKPRVGGGAAHVQRISPDKLAEVISQLSDPDHFLVQPMISTIMSEGEYAFIFIDGNLSYTHLKKPAAGDYRVQGIYGGSLEVIEPTPKDSEQVQGIFETIPYDPLYARIDVVRYDGQLVVMELEMIEPILNFSLSPHGISDFTAAVLRKIQA